MTKPADSDQIAKARDFWPIWWKKNFPGCIMFEPTPNTLTFSTAFAASERQAVIEDCAKMADQIAQSCSACSYSREKHGEEPSFCENFGCSSFADLAAAIRSME